jgi:hypothetical protein
MNLAWTLAIVVSTATAALAAGPGAPLQVPEQAPQEAYKQAPQQQAPQQAPFAAQKQAPWQGQQQSPMQSPVQKGGGYSARLDSGYRSFSYEPGYGNDAYGSDSYGYDSYGASYSDYGSSFGRSRDQAAWRNVTNKALGRY